MDNKDQIRLEDAKWFAQEAGKLSSENQARIFNAKTAGDLRPVFGASTDRYWRAFESWRVESSLGNQIQIPHPRNEQSALVEAKDAKNLSDSAKSAVGIATLGSFFAADRIKNRDYYKFKKERDKFIEEELKKWKSNPDPTYAKSEIGARNRAANEFHDLKLGESTDTKIIKKYQKWAEKPEEEGLRRAFRRKEILEKDNPKRDEKELNKYLDEQGIKNPEKIHRNPDGPSQEEVARRLDEAKTTAEQQQALNETNIRLKKLQEDIDRIKREKKSNSRIIIPRQVIHHPVPTPSSPAQVSRPVFRGRGRRALGGRVGGAIKGGAKNVAKKMTKEGTKKFAAALVTNPYFWIVIGIAAAIFVLIVVIATQICQLTSAVDFIRPDWVRAMCAENETAEEIPSPPNGVTIVKTGPDAVPNDQDGETELEYTITVTYDPAKAEFSPEEMTLVDVPEYDHTILVGTTSLYDTVGISPNQQITWKLSDFIDEKSGPFTFAFILNLSTTVTDQIVTNNAYVKTPQGIVGDLISTGPEVKQCTERADNDIWKGADCLPTSNDCSGRWATQMTRTESRINNLPAGTLDSISGSGYNFGDPLCTYDRKKLKAVILELGESEDRTNFWLDIASCEGTVNSFGTQVSPIGPAGTFQMRGSRDLFHEWQPSQNTRGDVPWQRQAQMAIKWNNELRSNNNDFEYWGTARCLCYYDGYKTMDYCKDIIDDGLQRTPAVCNNNKCAGIGERGPL